MTPESQKLLTIGWREWVALPDVGIAAIKAKIDSGARTSCLHTADYEIFQKDGVDRIVRDSGGHEEKRPFIRTNLHIADQIWPIEFSLSNRENMKFRMLLGRTGMAQRAVIDCSKSYLTKSKPHYKKS